MLEFCDIDHDAHGCKVDCKIDQILQGYLLTDSSMILTSNVTWVLILMYVLNLGS